MAEYPVSKNRSIRSGRQLSRSPDRREFNYPELSSPGVEETVDNILRKIRWTDDQTQYYTEKQLRSLQRSLRRLGIPDDDINIILDYMDGDDAYQIVENISDHYVLKNRMGVQLLLQNINSDRNLYLDVSYFNDRNREVAVKNIKNQSPMTAKVFLVNRFFEFQLNDNGRNHDYVNIIINKIGIVDVALGNLLSFLKFLGLPDDKIEEIDDVMAQKIQGTTASSEEIFHYSNSASPSIPSSYSSFSDSSASSTSSTSSEKLEMTGNLNLSTKDDFMRILSKVLHMNDSMIININNLASNGVVSISNNYHDLRILSRFDFKTVNGNNVVVEKGSVGTSLFNGVENIAALGRILGLTSAQITALNANLLENRNNSSVSMPSSLDKLDKGVNILEVKRVANVRGVNIGRKISIDNIDHYFINGRVVSARMYQEL